MKKVSAALVSASLLALSACGGAEEAAVNNATDYEVVDDNLTATENSLDSLEPALGNDVNALGNATANVVENAVVTNTTTSTTTTNTTGNSQ